MAELYLPEIWFDEAHALLCQRWHIPPDRTFLTKPQLGLLMIQRAKAHRLPLDRVQGRLFAIVGCDGLYGQDGQFRADLATEEVLYMAESLPRTRSGVRLEQCSFRHPAGPIGPVAMRAVFCRTHL